MANHRRVPALIVVSMLASPLAGANGQPMGGSSAQQADVYVAAALAVRAGDTVVVECHAGTIRQGSLFAQLELFEASDGTQTGSLIWTGRADKLVNITTVNADGSQSHDILEWPEEETGYNFDDRSDRVFAEDGTWRFAQAVWNRDDRCNIYHNSREVSSQQNTSLAERATAKDFNGEFGAEITALSTANLSASMMYEKTTSTDFLVAIYTPFGQPLSSFAIGQMSISGPDGIYRLLAAPGLPALLTVIGGSAGRWAFSASGAGADAFGNPASLIMLQVPSPTQ